VLHYRQIEFISVEAHVVKVAKEGGSQMVLGDLWDVASIKLSQYACGHAA